MGTMAGMIARKSAGRTRMAMPEHMAAMASHIGKKPAFKPTPLVQRENVISAAERDELAVLKAFARKQREISRRKRLEKIVKMYDDKEIERNNGIFKRGQMAAVIDAFTKITGISGAQLKSAQRSYTLARPRQRLFWILLNFGPWSTGEVGRALNRDHSTIVHGRQVVDKKPEMKELAMLEYETIVNVMYGG